MQLTSRRLAALVLLLVGTLTAPAALAGDAQLSRTLTDRGIEMQDAGDHVRAVTLFDAALAEFDHPKIRYFRAKSLRALERYDEALAEFNHIKDLPQMVKYRQEVIAFMSDIEADRRQRELERRLDDERRARVEVERERRALEERAEQLAVERIKSRQSPLAPPYERRPRDGASNGRIVPLLPVFAAPTGEYTGAIEAIEHARALGSYQTELTVAKAFTVAAVVGVSVGVGLGANPAGAGGEARDGVRQAGLAIGVVGLMSGLVALVLWPDEPADPRPETDPYAPDPYAPDPFESLPTASYPAGADG